ncbi:fungal-specific transcription factor domain-containing protein [Xylariales sp. PMI_506]|nr:fungal-specific transcription factor domain-containing protein [Xylariales sp. PMI_506]
MANRLHASPLASTSGPSGQKPPRKRVVLSCALCRSAKLKCDRESPCSQCARRGLSAAECIYVPLPDNMRKSRSMAARLRELEGTVRGLIQDATKDSTSVGKDAGGRVVFGNEGKGTYVGATHFMTVLNDLEDLKQYFEESEPDEEETVVPHTLSDRSYDMWILSENSLCTKSDLLRLFPPPPVLSRLVMRYFTWKPPSSVIIHRPNFNRKFHAFQLDPAKSTYEFLALILAILAEATLFSFLSVPQEIIADSTVPPMSRFKAYRSGIAWALSAADYTTPSKYTIPPLLLNLEAEFVLSRATPMACYLLSSTCLRLMLRLGFHRDPDHLPNVSTFAGEMRRRMWHFGLQIEMLVSFQMGLPSLIYGMDTDVKLPRNLDDGDLQENMTELPPDRPNDEHSPLTYSIMKSSIGNVFSMITKLTNSLTQPIYAEVKQLDAKLQDVWAQVPPYLKVRPIEHCVTDDPLIVTERFSLGSLYHTGQCILHRRYLSQVSSDVDHIYSRSTCLHAALVLLDYQNMYYNATRPGSMLSQHIWFLRPILLGDFLLAAVIIYLSLQSTAYPEIFETERPVPNKSTLWDVLARSRDIWASMAASEPGFRKPATILATMVSKAKSPSRNGEELSEHVYYLDVMQSAVATQTPTSELDQSETAIDQAESMGNSNVSSQMSSEFSGSRLESEPWLFLEEGSMLDWHCVDEAMRLPGIWGEMPADWTLGTGTSHQDFDAVKMSSNGEFHM